MHTVRTFWLQVTETPLHYFKQIKYFCSQNYYKVPVLSWLQHVYIQMLKQYFLESISLSPPLPFSLPLPFLISFILRWGIWPLAVHKTLPL